MTLQEILKSARINKNLTLNELSKKTGISVTSLNKYENNKALPNIDNLYKIVEVLGLDYNSVYNIYLKDKEKNKTNGRI